MKIHIIVKNQCVCSFLFQKAVLHVPSMAFASVSAADLFDQSRSFMCYLLGIQLVFGGFAGAVLFGKATKDSTCATCSKG